MTDELSISVVIRMHCQAHFVREAVDSVRVQTRPADEIVIVDDGADRETADVLRSLQQDVPNLRVVSRSPARGPAASFNDGVRASSGSVIVALDADDRLSSTYLELMGRALADPDVAFAYAGERRFGSEEGWRSVPAFDVDRLLTANYVNVSAMFRREVFDATGGFRGDLDGLGCEDWEFWVHAASLGYLGRRVEGCWLWYRRHASGSRGTFSRARSWRIHLRLRALHPTAVTWRHLLRRAVLRSRPGTRWPETGDPVKVFELVTKLSVGGAQETVLRSAQTVSPERFDVSIVAGGESSPEGDLWAMADERGVKTWKLHHLRRSVQPFRDALAAVELAALLFRERPIVLHTHSSKAGVLGRVVGWIVGVPAVVHTVHGWSFHIGSPVLARWLIIRAERLLARLTDVLVVVTVADRHTGEQHRIIPRGGYEVIRSGIPVAAFRADRHARRERALRAFGIVDDRPVIGWVGRLATQKDPLGLIRAAEAAAERLGRVHLVLIGDGPLRGEVEAHCARSTLVDSHLLGARDDVAVLYDGFDVFALASRWEGLPRVVLEAIASEVPIVATDVGGIREVIEDGLSGRIVPPGDPGAFAEALVEVLDDRQRAATFAQRAVAGIAEFDEQVMGDRLTDLYQRLLAEVGRGGVGFGAPGEG